MTGYRHCFIVIVGNPALTGGATNIYSLFPEKDVGVPKKNDPRDIVPYYADEATCYPVGHCDAEKEKCIDKNYTDPGPSKNYKKTGPNSNTYTRYTTTKAKCVPPQIPDAPGY